MCSAHATVRGLLGEIVAQGDYHGDILVDMEAGLEHLSRGTGRHVSRILAVLEPYYRSMETASRVAALASELGIGEVLAVSNKVRDEGDRAAIAGFCSSRGLNLVAEIPHDPALAAAERGGAAPIEHAPASPAIQAIRQLAAKLTVAALLVVAPGLSAQAPLRLVGRSDLGGGGLNGAVAVVGTTAIVGAGVVPAAGVHAQLYNPLTCPAVAVKIVDLSQPERPRVVATIPVPAGVVAQDVAALRVRTPAFTGDLAAIALALCGGGGNGIERGVVYYDISDPAKPALLGRYRADEERIKPEMRPCAPAPSGSDERCAASQHSVTLVQRPDGSVLSLSTEPGASAANYPSGDLRVVDVTDPRSPKQVSAFPPPGRAIFSNNGCRPFSAAHSASVRGDGSMAALAYYDDGVFLLDLARPEAPVELGRFGIAGDRELEGNFAYVHLTEVSGRRFALVSEQDWIAGAARLRIAAPSSLAGDKFACEAVFTLFDPAGAAQLHRRPGATVAGEIVYLGRGCAPGVGTGMHEGTVTSAADPYLGDPAGRIALIDRSRQPTQPDLSTGVVCSVADRVRRAQASGALAVIVAQTGTAAVQAFSPDGHPAGITIPVVQIDQRDGDALRGALCPAGGPSGRCANGERIVGALAGSKGEWGGLRIVDVSDPKAPREIAVHRTPRAGVFPPPDLGVYSVHHAIARDGIAYVVWNSDGLRVLDLRGASPEEIGFFLPPDLPDPHQVFPSKAYTVGIAFLMVPSGKQLVVVTDVNGGLFVVEPPSFR